MGWIDQLLGNPKPMFGVAGIARTNSTSFVALGIVALDPTKFFGSPQYFFKASLEVTGGLTAAIQLYDLTAGAVVSGSLVTTTSATPILLASSALTFARSLRLYEVQARISVGTPGVSDQLTCKIAYVDPIYS